MFLFFLFRVIVVCFAGLKHCDEAGELDGRFHASRCSGGTVQCDRCRHLAGVLRKRSMKPSNLFDPTLTNSMAKMRRYIADQRAKIINSHGDDPPTPSEADLNEKQHKILTDSFNECLNENPAYCNTVGFAIVKAQIDALSGKGMVYCVLSPYARVWLIDFIAFCDVQPAFVDIDGPSILSIC